MEEMAKRLRIVAQLGGFPNDTALVAALDISHSRWSNYVNGTHPLPLELGIRLCELIPGLSLDWIYRDVQAGLSVRILGRIRRLRKAQDQQEA